MFAAQEATNFLSRAFGRPVPVVNRPTLGKTSLVLGQNIWLREAGVSLKGRPRDTYCIAAQGSRVYVAGKDNIAADPLKADPTSYERGTLLGVYAFLEEYVGCRFYFPDELGEVVPQRDRIVVPDGQTFSTPDFQIRKYYCGDGRWFFDVSEGELKRLKNLNWLRLRASTTTIPCCHGTAFMKFVERFAKTHPEYFALRSDGTRCHTYTGSKSSRNGYLCFSSGIRDEIVEECVRRFKAGAKYVDIMPNDSLPDCFCEKCQAVYRKDRPCPASELIWDYTRYVANELIRRKVPGVVTQMAYANYRRVPDFDIPTNVYVMVAETGPWSLKNAEKLKAERDEIRAWKAKIGNPVYLWSYPHKYGPLNIPGIPDVAPRAWGEYYKGLAGDIIGTFAESETDKWIYHYLNYYVFSRVMWDAKTDVDAVIDEHHRLMFGAGAASMKRFYEILERKWVDEIVGVIEVTQAGPLAVPPTEDKMWAAVYGPETIAELASHLDEAAASVRPGSIEARRIAFIRIEYFDALVVGAETHVKKRQAIDSLVWRAKTDVPIKLIPYRVRKGSEPAEYVKTQVSVRLTAEDLIVDVEAEDNRMDDQAGVLRRHDDKECWKDSSMEIFLNPSADLKNYFHLIVNLEGSIYDAREVLLGTNRCQADGTWESKAEVNVAKRSDGWHMTVKIPRSSLCGMTDVFPAEFARNRVTKSGKGFCRYHWSPYAFNFNALNELGKIDLR